MFVLTTFSLNDILLVVLCKYATFVAHADIIINFIVKLRQGSGKDRQGMAVKVKGLKASTLA